MTWLIALPVLVVWLVWPTWTPVAFMLALVVGLVAGAVRGAHSPRTPSTIRRFPTRYEQRHRPWRLGFGFALGFHGVFPFVYISRRLR